MNSRFEQAITAGVLAGAIALAGCSSSSGGGGNGGDEEPGAEFLGGRTISDTEIELRFTAAVTVGDASAAAGMFTITANKLNFGVAGSDSVPSGVNVVSQYVDCTFDCLTFTFTAWYSFTPYDSEQTMPEVTGVTTQEETIFLTLSAPIDADADTGTGMLRLTYTGEATGILDADGNALPDITLGIEERGNVADTVSLITEGPILIGARTIDSRHVELIFNEPVVIATLADALQSFAITNNNELRDSGAFGFGFFPDVSSTSGAEWAALNASFSWDLSSDTAEHQVYAGSVDAETSIVNIAVSADAPERLVLTLGGAIPAGADGGTGRLRAYYTDGVDVIEDADGNPMVTFGNGPLHRGNVKDTID